MKEHELKTWPVYYNKIVSGTKKFEVRKNDRGFEVGDLLNLREWKPTYDVDKKVISGKYTGRESQYCVDYILSGPGMGIMDGFVVMSIRRHGLIMKEGKDER